MTDRAVQLLLASPCTDAGENAAVTVAVDLAGHPRIVDGDADLDPVVDMWAYEYQPLMASLDVMPDVCPNGLNLRRAVESLRPAIAESKSVDVK